MVTRMMVFGLLISFLVIFFLCFFKVIRRIRKSAFPLSSFDAEGPDSIVEFENPDAAIHPEWSAHPPKRRFIPSKWENKRINELVSLIRRGKIRLERTEVPDVSNAVCWAQ